MRSMTGFGVGEATAGGLTVAIELRAINHRFLDVAVKLPSALAPYELEIRTVLKEQVARGRVSCNAQLTQSGPAAPIALAPERLEQGLALLRELAGKLETMTGQRPAVDLSHLLAVPDLFESAGSELDAETVLTALRGALGRAVAELNAMRDQEGRELAADLARRCATVRTHLAEVNRLAPGAAREAFEKLQQRLAQLIADAVDPQRLAQEAALLADRANIAEECERLASHLDQFDQALADGGQVAKRLNFLLQEMHREVNTMGSKTSLLAITQLVIAMKEEVESMREQVQNLE